MNDDIGTIDYAAVLADLERRRDDLDRAIESIRPLAGLAGAGPQPPTGGGSGAGGAKKQKHAPTELRSDSFFGMKAPEAISRYLTISKGPRSVRDIVDALKSGGFISGAKDLYNNLYTALGRMEEAGTVRKLPDGTWGLSEWYPARPKSKAAKGDPLESEQEEELNDDETAA